MTVLQKGGGPCFCSKTSTLLYTKDLILKLIFYHLSGTALEKLFFLRPASNLCFAMFGCRNGPRESTVVL